MKNISISKIDTHIKKHQVFKAKDLEAFLERRSLIRTLIQQRKIIQFGSGYYVRADLPTFEASILILAKYYPKAVVSGESALKLHGLLDEADVIHADIPKNTSQRSHHFSFCRVAESRMIGVEEKIVLGTKVKVYSADRALADALLKKVGKTKFQSALARFLEKRKIKNKSIEELDNVLGTDLKERVEKALLQTVYAPKVPKNSGAAPKPAAAPDISERERLLMAATLVYSRGGTAGLDMKSLSEESGVEVSAIARHFPNKTELRKAVLDLIEARILETGAKPLYQDLSPREWLHANVNAFMNMSEMDEIGHMIQRWCLAEKNQLVASIMKHSSVLVRKISEVVMSEVSGIDAKSAEARALSLVAMLDTYASIVWFYSDKFEIESTKQEMIRNYRKEVVDQIDAVLFRPFKQAA